jgi:aquaporin-4
MTLVDRFMASSVRDLKSSNLYKSLLAEMIGVMFLVLLGCSSPYGESFNGMLDLTKISLAFGLTVATMVWILASTSGGHINPAVSAGMFVARKISLARFVLYVGFQLIGGIIGSALQSALVCEWQLTARNKSSCELGMTTLDNGVTPAQGFGIEFLITFLLVFTVFATCDKNRKDLAGSGPLAIGIAVTIGHLAFAPMTGVSMNTARTFGPAVILGVWENHWVYWVGPISGGIVAALLYEFIFAGNAHPNKVGAWLIEGEYEVTEERPEDIGYEMKDGRSAASNGA